MPLPIHVVDAFTTEPFAGNPAAVVIGHGADEWMQQVAAEMKHAETAFLRERPDGSFDLRWFTPEVEVDLCGHATLASAHVLHETNGTTQMTFHTRSGALHASVDEHGAITLDFPVGPLAPAAPMPDLYAALGVNPVDFLATDGAFYCCVVADPNTVRNTTPDFVALHALQEVRGVYVTARGDEGYDIVSRCFAPRVGINEDSVTGSMHSVLASYWCDRIGKDELRAYQASARGGEMTVLRKGDRALLTGRATTVLRGALAT